MTESHTIKVLAVATAVLAIVVAFLVYQLYAQGDNPGTYADTNTRVAPVDTAIDQSLVKYWNEVRPIHPDTTGEFIEYMTAVQQGTRYRMHRRNEPVLSSQPYGFAFGRLKLQQLLDNIAKTNSKLKSPKDSIQGVRIYLVKKTSKVNGQEVEHFDVLLVPAKGDGYNFIPIGDEIAGKAVIADYTNAGVPTDGLLLNTSSPCPDVCDPK